MKALPKAVCPSCGSERLEKAKDIGGNQMRCRNCGYEGPALGDFY